MNTYGEFRRLLYIPSGSSKWSVAGGDPALRMASSKAECNGTWSSVSRLLPHEAVIFCNSCCNCINRCHLISRCHLGRCCHSRTCRYCMKISTPTQARATHRHPAGKTPKLAKSVTALILEMSAESVKGCLSGC